MIREYRDEDRESILRLLREFIAYTRESYDADVLHFDDYRPGSETALLDRFLSYEQGILLVAEEDGAIGYILGRTSENPLVTRTKAGMVKSFFVTAKERDKGIGKALFDALIDRFLERGCDHLELDVQKGNPAKGLYEHLGFKETMIRMKRDI